MDSPTGFPQVSGCDAFVHQLEVAVMLKALCMVAHPVEISSLVVLFPSTTLLTSGIPFSYMNGEQMDKESVLGPETV